MITRAMLDEMIAAEHRPATYPVMLTFSDGTYASIEVTVKKKPTHFYTLERDICASSGVN